ncbi:MAG: hypothetical protein IJO88_07040 [Oscillospiraceae bacterium]|nr:hypothetical protein [Oscillospiraceae bacterium]
MEEQQIIAKILKKPVEDEKLRETLEHLKLKPTYGNGILLQMVRKAAGGDLTAAKYILDTARPKEEDSLPAGTDLREVPTEELRKLAAEERR